MLLEKLMGPEGKSLATVQRQSNFQLGLDTDE